MPVIVNELEVVVAPPADTQDNGRAPAPAGPPSLTTFEISALLERRTRQLMRIFAH